jgi:transposase
MLKEMERTVIKYLRKKGKKYKEIGEEIGCHRVTASKVMKDPVDKKYKRPAVENQVTPYRKEIEEWINKGIKVNRMMEKAREELYPPYKGSRSVFYEQVSKIKKELKEKHLETFIRFEGLAGEYLQIDWGEVRDFPFINKERQTRYIFAARLKYSRVIYAEFQKDMKLETLIRCIIRAFEYIGGIPWTCAFDNMKTVIIGRDEEGKPIWNEGFKKFSVDMDFYRHICDPYSGNQKGSVENLVKTVKGNFVGGREFVDDVDLSKRCKEWLEKMNSNPCQAHNRIPFELLADEQKKFTPLQTNSKDYGIMTVCKVNQESRIHLENNIYSVPAKYVNQAVIIRITEDRILIHDPKGTECVAEHRRRFGKGEKVIVPSHYEEVLKRKPKGRAMLYRDHLISQDEQIYNFISNLCRRRRGVEAFGPDMIKMYELYNRHGKDEFLAAIALSSEWECYGSEYLEYLLEIPARGNRQELLPLRGMPVQKEIDRPMEVYMNYVKGGTK